MSEINTWGAYFREGFENHPLAVHSAKEHDHRLQLFHISYIGHAASGMF